MGITYRLFFLSHVLVVSNLLRLEHFLASAVLGLENVQLDVDVLKSLILGVDSSLLLFKLLLKLSDFSGSGLNFG